MMTRFLKLPVLLGCVVFLSGLFSVLLSTWQPQAERVSLQLESPEIRLQPQEIQLVVYLDPQNFELSQPKYKTVDLPLDKPQRLLRILSALRDNLEGLWPEALPLPMIFLKEQTVVLHFQFDNTISVSVEQEQRLYKSIQSTLAENGVATLYILVNDQSETFLGHVALENVLE
jgi:hypothetical protein